MISLQQKVTLGSLLATWFMITSSLTSVNANFTQTSELYRKLFSDLDSRIHPSLNASVPTDVYVQLNILSLREIVETEQYFVINTYMTFTWRDEIRTWDPAEYDSKRVIYPGPLGMWKPRVVLANSMIDRDPFQDDYFALALYFDGRASWYPGTVFYISCTMDMTYFPFDRQTCKLRFLAQEYTTDVNLIPAATTVNTDNYVENGEWDLESTRAESRSSNYKGLQFSRLVFTFNFRRRPAFYLMNVLVPVVLMSLLSPLVFMLPEESGERVSYAVTLLLSLSVFMGIVAGQLPQSSKPLPLSVIYLFMMLIHSGLCVVCTVAHLRWEKYKLEHNESNRSNDPELIKQPEQQQQPLKSSNLSVDHKQQTKESAFSSRENGFPNQPILAYNSKEFFKASKYHDSLNLNGMVGFENINFNGLSEEENRSKDELMKKENSSRIHQLSCQYFWSANAILFVFFYLLWFAISGYFLMSLL